ncbi:MAG: T9SS type A sorting domain-containing protein [Saprospiraceae bacterium]
MKNFSFALFIVLSYAQWIAAQAPSAYAVYPNPSDTVTALDIETSTAFAQIKNLSTDSIFVKWARNVIYVSPNVGTAVCDPDRCWYTSTQTNTFGMAGNSVGNLYVSFLHPINQAASGIVHLKLSNQNNAADTLMAVYSFSTLTGTGELPTPNVRLFPNPTADFFTLENAQDVASMRLFTLDGREVARFVTSPGNTYSIANQPVGNYVLSFEDKNGQLFQALELNKR